MLCATGNSVAHFKNLTATNEADRLKTNKNGLIQTEVQSLFAAPKGTKTMIQIWNKQQDGAFIQYTIDFGKRFLLTMFIIRTAGFEALSFFNETFFTRNCIWEVGNASLSLRCIDFVTLKCFDKQTNIVTTGVRQRYS